MANKPDTSKEAEARAKAAEKEAKAKEKAAAAEEKAAKAKKDQESANAILIRQAKEQFAIDQKIELITIEIKRLKAVEGEVDAKAIMAAKKRLSELKESKKVMTEINEVHLEALDSSDKESVLLYDIKANKKKIQKITENLKDLESGKLDLSEAETEELIKQGKAQVGLLKANEKTAGKVQEINRQYEQVLGALGTSIQSLKGMKDGAIAFGRALMANPYLAITAAVAMMVAGFVDLVKKSQELQKEMKINLRDAMNMTEELNRSTFSFGFLIQQAKDFQKGDWVRAGKNWLLGVEEDDIKKTMKAYSNLTGYILNTEQATSFAQTATNLGTSADDMLQIANQIRLSTGGAMDIETSFNQVAVYAAELQEDLKDANGNTFDLGEVMSDVAKNTGAFAEYGKGGGKNILQAAIAAKKLGLELSSLTKISDNLLDFESSIQSEMEASLMIGKQLNYNKARELALSGDLAGAAQDIASQIGGAAEFQKMNVMQRKSLAASMGLEVAEMEKLMSGGELAITQDPLIQSQDELNASMKELNATMSKSLADKAVDFGESVLATMSMAGLGSWGVKKVYDKSKSKFFGKENVPGGKGSKVPKTPKVSKTPGLSKWNPMNWGGKMNKAGTAYKASSKGHLMKLSQSLFDPKNIKKVLSKGKVSIGGIAAGLLIDPIKDAFTEEGSVMNKLLSVADKTATYAGTGALAAGAVGSVVPVAGNAIGATGGGIAGGILGFGMGIWEQFGDPIKNFFSRKTKLEEEKAAMEKQTEALKAKTANLQAEVAEKQKINLEKQEALLKLEQEKKLKEKEAADKAAAVAQKALEDERKKKEAADKAAAIAAQKAIEEQKKAEALRKQEAQKVVKVTQTDTGTGANRVRTRTRSSDLSQTATTAEDLQVQIDLQREMIARQQNWYNKKKAGYNEDGHISGMESRSLQKREEKIEKNQKRLEELLQALVVATQNVGKDVANQVINS